MGLIEKYFNSDLKDNPFFSELLSSCIEYSAKYGHCGFLLTDVVRSLLNVDRTSYPSILLTFFGS